MRHQAGVALHPEQRERLSLQSGALRTADDRSGSRRLRRSARRAAVGTAVVGPRTIERVNANRLIMQSA